MPLVMNDQSSMSVLRNFVAEDFVIRLFVNNVNPKPTDAADSFVECSRGGYAPITLTGGQWQERGNVVSYPAQKFTFTGPVGPVYGYFCTRADGTITHAERFMDGPYRVENDGDSIAITPTLSI